MTPLPFPRWGSLPVLAAILAGLGVPVTAPAGARATLVLDADEVTTAIVQVRQALPDGWRVADIRWETKPRGWIGESTCVEMELIDGTCRLPHSSGQFLYNPLHRIWFLPTGWEGRMEVTAYEGESATATYLGETPGYRVFHGTIGRNNWPDAPTDIAEILELVSYPLEHRPRHSLDVSAMQRLFQRLDTA